MPSGERIAVGVILIVLTILFVVSIVLTVSTRMRARVGRDTNKRINRLP